MAFRGFGKNSGPSTPPRAQTPFGHFPRPPSSSSTLSVSPRSPVDYGDLGAFEGMASPHLASSHPFPATYKSNEPPLRRGEMKVSSVGDRGPQTYQRPPGLQPLMDPNNTRAGTLAGAAEVQYIGRTNSSHSHSPQEVSKNFRGVSEIPSDLPLSNNRYMVPYRAQSPPLVLQNHQNVGGQLSHSEEVQQRPFSSPVWVNPSKSSIRNIRPPAQEGISLVSTRGGTYQSGPFLQTKNADDPLQKRTRSPTRPFSSGVSPEVPHSDGHRRPLIDYRDLDAPEEMPLLPLASGSSFPSRDSSSPFAGTQKPFPSSPTWANQSTSSSNNTTTLVQEDMSSVWTKRANYQSGRTPDTKNADVQLPKRTRSPTLPSTSGGLFQNPAITLDGNKRTPGFQSQSQSVKSGQTNGVEDPIEKPMHFPAVKRTKIPLQSSSDQVSQDNLDPAQEIERELQAKAKRLARFKDELSQPVQSHSTIKSQKAPAKRQHQFTSEKQKFSEDPAMDVMGDSAGANLDHESDALSGSIVGLCQDMCPEPERAERERKGDLDQYERLDGDRNLTSEYLAVKKYTRTAEREAELIRPLPILQKTMDYLLNLLDEPYDDRFLGLYNFLWDRMRAIRMDLRMQHIFNLEAISLLEQMIRLHIIAMHELCEYTKGEGFSEGFDAHLNIEQMNKTSVELFQFYDDHRKKGLHVPSEREFRGYYALLKLDKHPGYKVEPAELSLDLAKMTPEIRQTPEVLFARDVARACRTGNFIAFFRLARKATYLQACLMHAHFSKLRTQALASLHSGLQISQGIPITHVAKWLGMEEEDIESLLEYYGFSMKEFEEPYMVKESAFMNVDNDFPVKRSKLVERKRSRMIVNDVTFPTMGEEYAAEEVQESQQNKDPEPEIPTPSQFVVPVSTTQLHDEEMDDFGNTLSQKGSSPKPVHKTFTDLTTPDEKVTGLEVQVAPASPFVLEFPNSTSEQHQTRVESTQKPKYESVFRNSFGRSIKHDLEATPQTTIKIADENRSTAMPFDSVVHSPIQQPMFAEDLEDEQTGIMEEDKCDEATTSYYDEEVAVAKLKLILRIWKRRTTKKRELREHKQLAASAALNLLSLGPPICQFEEQSGNYGMFNIDHVMSERHEIQERSWSVLNPSDVIATKLISKNPDAKCLCWKLVLCSPDESHGDKSALSAAHLWLRSKLMFANNDGENDLLLSYPDTAIWRNWFPSQSGLDLTCCLSVIKSTMCEDLNQVTTGSNAVLFMLSDSIPLELQKKRLHDLVMFLPPGSHLPLLILSASSKDESDPAIIAKELGLHDIDKSRVIMFHINFLKDKDVKKLDGFFSDERLREGLEWLASESPEQIVVKGTKTRELVLSHLNATVEVLDEMNTHRIGPNNCISAFNEALDQSIKDIAAAALANPNGWPCPEIDLLEETSEEYRFAYWYLPCPGWSSASRTQVLIGALNDMKIPSLNDDLSWLYSGINNGDDIENMKSRLENCLINYLTETSQMMGISLAQKEAVTLLQNFTGLELHNMTYYIIPKWVSIFRRIFSWRLMKLNSGEVSSTYVLMQHSSDAVDNSVSKSIAFLPPFVANPLLDELVEVGCGSQGLGLDHMEYDAALLPWSPSPMASDGADVATSDDSVMLQSEENPARDSVSRSYDNLLPEKDNDGGQVMHKAKATKEADRLSELLGKCNIVQNMIDEKLSIYF